MPMTPEFRPGLEIATAAPCEGNRSNPAPAPCQVGRQAHDRQCFTFSQRTRKLNRNGKLSVSRGGPPAVTSELDGPAL